MDNLVDDVKVNDELADDPRINVVGVGIAITAGLLLAQRLTY